MSATKATRAKATSAPASTGPTFRGRPIDPLSLLLDVWPYLALGLIIVVFTVQSDTFFSQSNLLSMTKHVALIAILGIGMLFVILKGGIDLSVGSTLALSGIVAGKLLQDGIVLEWAGVILYPPVWVVVLISLSVGALVGFINGWFITRLNVAPFIATLGMLYIARGAALLLSDGTTYPKLQGTEELGNTGFDVFGVSRPLGVPMQIWLMILVAAIAWFVLAKTPLGRSIYAVGGNERASELAGVAVKRVKTRAYVISGICAALAGIITASQLGSAIPGSGETDELVAIAACVIGGASLMGGRGKVGGVLIGAFVIGFLADGLVNIGVSTFWQVAITGAVIVAAVALDQARERIKTAKNAAIAAAAKSDDSGDASPPKTKAKAS